MGVKMNLGENKKLYYSISEVAKMTDLEPYVLRFWEKEFSQLHPRKNRAGNRIYQEKDIQTVKTIKKLLYDEGYTIEGAKNALKRGYKGEDDIGFTKEQLIKLLLEIRGDLDELRKLFP